MVGSSKKNAIISSSMLFVIGLIFGIMYAVVRVFRYDIERYEHDATPESVRKYIRQTAGCEEFKQTTLR